MAKNKNMFNYLGLAALAAAAIALLNSSNKPNLPQVTDETVPDATPKQPTTTAPAKPTAPVVPVTPQVQAGYPIKWMVRNANAIPLQQALGVTADGIIGPQTLKALQKHTDWLKQGESIWRKEDRDGLINTIKGLNWDGTAKINWFNAANPFLSKPAQQQPTSGYASVQINRNQENRETNFVERNNMLQNLFS